MTHSTEITINPFSHASDMDDLSHKWHKTITLINQAFTASTTLEASMQAGIYDRAKAVDALLSHLTDMCIMADDSLPYCLCAIGGYGRSKLAPFSDIDIGLIYHGAMTDTFSQNLIEMEQLCWDLGLKPSLCIFEKNDLAELCHSDHQRMTSFLDMRFVAGDKNLYQQSYNTFRHDICQNERSVFIAHKLQERDQRHQKMGVSRYYLEPNIKENKGGLRDLQTLHWITNFLYSEDTIHVLKRENILNDIEAQDFYHASDFLWVVRSHLHLISNKAHEVLRFDLQLELAEAMGYKAETRQEAAENFMKDYFHIARKAGYLTRIFCAILEEKSLTSGLTEAGTAIKQNIDDFHGFILEHGRISIPISYDFTQEVSDIMRIFHLRQTTNTPLHPKALREIARAMPHISAKRLQDNARSNQYFLDILLSSNHSETMLRLMQETGVLAAIIPAFGAISAHMQYDMYHVFTADEHLIHAIGLMHKLNNGQLASEAAKADRIIQKITEKRVLFMAIMLHDIAKGTGEDHAIAGARLADTLCPRLGLTTHETKLVSWLVLNHLEMSKMALNRDIYDPKTILDFCRLLPNPEYLRLLYVLTVVDIMAVGPDRWNSWKEKLLDRLYDFSYQQLTGQSTHGSVDICAIKTSLKPLLPHKMAETFIHSAPDHYWHSFDRDMITSHIKNISQPDFSFEWAHHQCHIHSKINTDQNTTEVMIYTTDDKGIFLNMLRGFINAQSYIIDARVFTFKHGQVCDIFTIQNKNHASFDNLDFLYKKINQAFLNTSAQSAIQRGKPPSMADTAPVTVIIDNQASYDSSVIEISCLDRFGLLCDIAETLMQLNLQITSAKISTYGQNVVDVFYVRDAFGLKITKAHIKQHIIQTLKTALT